MQSCPLYWVNRRAKVTPLMFRFKSFLKGLRERFVDVGCGDDCEDQAGVFCSEEVYQADLPG